MESSAKVSISFDAPPSVPREEINRRAYEFYAEGGVAKVNLFAETWSKKTEGETVVILIREKIPMLRGLVHTYIDVQIRLIRPTNFNENPIVVKLDSIITNFDVFQNSMTLETNDAGKCTATHEVNFKMKWFLRNRMLIIMTKREYQKNHTVVLNALKQHIMGGW